MESLKMGHIIKKLRLNKNIKQDELAKILEVSTAAISKWENNHTYPDITQLPILANYFGVTIDKLMGYEKLFTQDETKIITNKFRDLALKNIEQSDILLDEYLKKYSYNNELKLSICKVGSTLCSNLKNNTKRENILKKIIKILKEIVDDTGEIKIKEEALFQLSGHYIFLRDYYNSQHCLKNIYKPTHNPESLLPIINIMQGKMTEGRQILQRHIQSNLDEVASSCFQLGVSYYYEGEEDIDIGIIYLKMAIDIRRLENNLFKAGLPYIYLAFGYGLKKDYEKCLNTLSELASVILTIDSVEKNKYYFLLDNKMDARNVYANLLPLLKMIFTDKEIYSSSEFINLTNTLKDFVSK
ncbi:helix-turn-helix transcriptional regulator [Clostridiaceae bacterium M8S5]|nr:helix-turn-helix transcriptional regulator [Clostridiaceae bacterium M8S5]